MLYKENIMIIKLSLCCVKVNHYRPFKIKKEQNYCPSFKGCNHLLAMINHKCRVQTRQGEIRLCRKQ